ncbi:MAG TPA: hypothetical protein VF303_03030 [Candidatus Nanoarchaeia archaeon]
MKKAFWQETGFSLIELILIISLLGIVLAVTTVNLFRPVTKAKVEAVSSDIHSLLREAQNKAMNSDTGGGSQSDQFGVHFKNDKYILFKGSDYDSGDSSNLVVDLPQNITITSTLPCPSPPGSCNNIVFQRLSGEVAGFDASNNSVCVTDTGNNQSRLINVNPLGVVDVQDGC